MKILESVFLHFIRARYEFLAITKRSRLAELNDGVSTEFIRLNYEVGHF